MEYESSTMTARSRLEPLRSSGPLNETRGRSAHLRAHPHGSCGSEIDTHRLQISRAQQSSHTSRSIKPTVQNREGPDVCFDLRSTYGSRVTQELIPSDFKMPGAAGVLRGLGWVFHRAIGMPGKQVQCFRKWSNGNWLQWKNPSEWRWSRTGKHSFRTRFIFTLREGL